MLQRVAGLGMDWKLKKFLGISAILEKIAKKVLWLVLPDEISKISLHNSTKEFCEWVERHVL